LTWIIKSTATTDFCSNLSDIISNQQYPLLNMKAMMDDCIDLVMDYCKEYDMVMILLNVYIENLYVDKG
jgi:hypothetical protein